MNLELNIRYVIVVSVTSLLLLKNHVIVINKKLRHSRITSSSCSHNTRVELGLRVRDNTRTGFVKPRGSLSGTLRGIPGGGEHVMGDNTRVDLGLCVGMLRGLHAFRGVGNTSWGTIHAWT